MEKEHADIMAKLDEILEYLHTRKPEVDEKLAHVGNVCSVSNAPHCKCGCKCCTTGKCTCEGCEPEEEKCDCGHDHKHE